MSEGDSSRVITVAEARRCCKIGRGRLNLAWQQFVTQFAQSVVAQAAEAKSASLLVIPGVRSLAATSKEAAELQQLLGRNLVRVVETPSTKTRIVFGASRLLARFALVPGIALVGGLFLASVLVQNTMLRMAEGLLIASRQQEPKRDEEEEEKDPCQECILSGTLPQQTKRRLTMVTYSKRQQKPTREHTRDPVDFPRG